MVLCTDCKHCVLRYGSKTITAWCKGTDDFLTPEKIYDDSECDFFVNVGSDDPENGSDEA